MAIIVLVRPTQATAFTVPITAAHSTKTAYLASRYLATAFMP